MYILLYFLSIPRDVDFARKDVNRENTDKVEARLKKQGSRIGTIQGWPLRGRPCLVSILASLILLPASCLSSLI